MSFVPNISRDGLAQDAFLALAVTVPAQCSITGLKVVPNMRCKRQCLPNEMGLAGLRPTCNKAGIFCHR